MSHLPGKFVWFEHAGSDVARARAFYKSLLGWEVERTPLGYDMITCSGSGIGGMRGGEPGKPSHWACYVSVSDVDASFAAAMAAGALARVPPTDFVPAGRGASLVDPTGAQLWLWRGASSDRPDDRMPAIGDWVWTELCTPDAAHALSFYEPLLGYTRETRDLGPGGRYHLLRKGDHLRAGVIELAANLIPAMWLPYVRVRDCDACVLQARALGAQRVVVAPADIPDIGRFAVLADPLGAAIGIMQLAGPA